MTNADRYVVVVALTDAFADCGSPHVGRLKRVQQEALEIQLAELTVIEREPGLRSELHRLVAMAKQVLTRKTDDEAFVHACRELAGLI